MGEDFWVSRQVNVPPEEQLGCSVKGQPVPVLVGLPAVAYATVGVEPTASMEEVTSVYHAEIKRALTDGAQDPEGKRIREQRIQRLNLAYEKNGRARQGR